MLDSITQAKISDSVEKIFERQVQFLQELVRFPSQRGEEAKIQQFLASKFKTFGYEVDLWKLDLAELSKHPGFSPVVDTTYDNAFNLVGTLKPKEVKGRSLILNAHVDVVPTGKESSWSASPYEPIIKEGWMYGRGAGDMKCGLSANVFAIEAIKSAGLNLQGTIYQQSVVEEEATGNGALATVVRGYKADGVLITEPTGEVIRRGQVGVIWIRVDLNVPPVHAGRRVGSSGSVIESCFPLMNALRALEQRWNDSKPASFSHIDNAIKIVISKIKGGEWTSSTPSNCSFDARIGIFPERTVAECQREIEACIFEAAKQDPLLKEHPPKILYHGFLSPGYVLPAGTEIEKVLASAHKALHSKEAECVVHTALTDSRFYVLYQNTPSMVYGPITKNIHGFDEAVDLESLKRVTKVAACFIADWCGVK